MERSEGVERRRDTIQQAVEIAFTQEVIEAYKGLIAGGKDNYSPDAQRTFDDRVLHARRAADDAVERLSNDQNQKVEPDDAYRARILAVVGDNHERAEHVKLSTGTALDGFGDRYNVRRFQNYDQQRPLDQQEIGDQSPVGKPQSKMGEGDGASTDPAAQDQSQSTDPALTQKRKADQPRERAKEAV